MTENDKAFYHISPIKRNKLKKEQDRIKKSNLRATLPVLTLVEIRKHKLPRHEALILDLEELGLNRSAKCLQELTEFQENLRQESGPYSNVWQRPQLIYTKKELKVLFAGLRNAELGRLRGDYATEWSEILKLIVRYAFGVDDWWWITDRLFLMTGLMNCDENYKKYEAISYYIFGKYLHESVKNIDSAIYYLELARNLSDDKGWNAKKFLDDKQGTVFMESSSLLYQALYLKAELIMKTDLSKASEICSIARKMSASACDFDGEFNSLVLKGKCELLQTNSTAAIVNFNRALKIATKQNWGLGICEARVQLALGYLQHGKSTNALTNLKELKEFAEKEEFPFYVAQAYRYLGEYHLNLKEASVATPLLTTAYYLFQKSGHTVQREEVRILAAISKGEELYPLYAQLIQGCDDEDFGFTYLTKMLAWKDGRVPFWTDSAEQSEEGIADPELVE